MSNHLQDSEDVKNLDEHFELRPREYNDSVPTQQAGVAKVHNFLEGISKEQLYVEAAVLAQRPHDFANIAEISAKDKESLDYELAHKRSGPWKLYFTVIVCAIGAATQGWDQTGSNGANLSFPADFGIATPYNEPGGAADEWRVGFVNSAPYISASLVGVWLSDPLNNYFGWRGEIFISSIILIITPIASSFTHSWQALLAVRLTLRLGLGAKAATVPMYAAELAPAVVRGALVMGWQLWTAFGIFIGFCANAVVKAASPGGSSSDPLLSPQYHLQS